MNRLKNKVALIYGNGAVGGAIAAAFAHQGARIFLAGRTDSKLKSIADEVRFDGGTIETTTLDTLDVSAVEQHVQDVIRKAGRIDISFNATGLSSRDVEHIPLLDLSVENFSLPIAMYTRSHFVTAQVAARQMVKQGRGVIMMHTANISRVSTPFAGGRPPAWAALESLCRSLSVECGDRGVRAVCLLTTAIPETPAIEEAFRELFEKMKAAGMTEKQFQEMTVANTHRKRLTTLKELTDTAVFAASDEANGITGTAINVTAGMIA